jgi:glutathione-regulated potassium-efflux system ancillary protein KefF
MIDLIYAHPYPHRSRANRILLEAVRDMPAVNVRSLYDLYPDFAIDVAAEQQALSEADVVVWQHPLYWYSVPALLKLWFDKVLSYGWAYGEDAQALAGKRCLWVVTAGGDQSAFSLAGMHGHHFDSFVAPIAQTARFCRMEWLAPLVLQGARRVSDQDLQRAALNFRARLSELTQSSVQEHSHV